MFPYYSNVVLSTNVYSDPVITVTIGCSSFVIHGKKPLFRRSTYTVTAMLMQLRASRRKISSYLAIEQTKVCPTAGETDTIDDVIERLLCLDYMINESGAPFNPDLFQGRFGKLPFVCDHRTRQLVKEYLLR
jgi:hypothetical protein